MQKCDKGLPRIFFVAMSSHRFQYLCLDNVNCIRTRFREGTYFRTAILKHSVYAIRTLVSIVIPRVSF